MSGNCEHERGARENALQHQVQEIRLSAEEKEKFKAAMAPIYERFYKDYGKELEEILEQGKK